MMRAFPFEGKESQKGGWIEMNSCLLGKVTLEGMTFGGGISIVGCTLAGKLVINGCTAPNLKMQDISGGGEVRIEKNTIANCVITDSKLIRMSPFTYV